MHMFPLKQNPSSQFLKKGKVRKIVTAIRLLPCLALVKSRIDCRDRALPPRGAEVAPAVEVEGQRKHALRCMGDGHKVCQSFAARARLTPQASQCFSQRELLGPGNAIDALTH